MGFEPYLKVHNLVSVHPKNIILGQMINLAYVTAFLQTGLFLDFFSRKIGQFRSTESFLNPSGKQ